MEWEDVTVSEVSITDGFGYAGEVALEQPNNAGSVIIASYRANTKGEVRIEQMSNGCTISEEELLCLIKQKRGDLCAERKKMSDMQQLARFWGNT